MFSSSNLYDPYIKEPTTGENASDIQSGSRNCSLKYLQNMITLKAHELQETSINPYIKYPSKS